MAPGTLRDKLQRANARSFVGRDELRSWFQSACSGSSQESILFGYGPGGVGKTTLVRHFAAAAVSSGRTVYVVDGRIISANSESFVQALHEQLAAGHDADLWSQLSLESPVILIDTFEELSKLEEWIVTEFLVKLPETAVVVIVGRNRPGAVWHAEPGWDQLVRSEPLRNFTRADSVAFLATMNIPEELHETVIGFSHGHPLALTLFAEVHRQRPTSEFKPAEDPDIIKTLLDRFVQKVPSQAHRAAIESCAIVRSMTEELLNVMLDSTQGHELFEWLRNLSFMETGPDGIYPHDLARNVLVSDLKWRNAAWYHQLHDRARNFYSTQLEKSESAKQEEVLFEYIYLHRDNPVVRPFIAGLRGESPAAASRTVVTKSEREEVVSLASSLEGDEPAALLDRWVKSQPDSCVRYKNAEGELTGFLLALSLESADDKLLSQDPVTERVVKHLAAERPLEPGDRALMFRFWMARDSHQGLSRVQSHLFVEMVRHYIVTPHLTYTFLPVASPEFWAPILGYADLHRVEALDYEEGGREYGVFVHDWKTTPVSAWLDLLAGREVGMASAVPPSAGNLITALSKEDFVDALDDSLRNFSRPWKLNGNPLLQSAFVTAALTEGAGIEERIQALQDCIEGTTATLSANPKLEKGRRAIERTYLKPSGSQELAAEALGMPFSTFRRHLKKGVEELREAMWLVEIGR